MCAALLCPLAATSGHKSFLTAHLLIPSPPLLILCRGFEQILKNSLTTLSMGGAKGGSDFDPKGGWVGP